MREKLINPNLMFKKISEDGMKTVSGGRTYWKNGGSASGGDGNTYQVWEQWKARWPRADIYIEGSRTFGDAPQQTD